jgi:hypothetical protein
MEVEFSLTPDDLRAPGPVLQERNRAWNRPTRDPQQRVQKPKSRASGNWVWWVILVWLIFMFFVNEGMGRFRFEPVPLLLALLLCLILGVVIMVLLFYWAGKVSFQRDEQTFADERNQWLFRPRRLTISPDGFTTASWLQAYTVRWEAIWDIAVRPDYVIFFDTTTSGHVIPRRAFRDQQHFEEFVALARQYKEGPRTTGIMTGPPPRSTDIFRREDS